MDERIRKLDHMIQTCINALEEDDWTLEECLKHFAADEDELEPLLLTALSVRKAGNLYPSPQFKQQTLQRLLNQFQSHQVANDQPFTWKNFVTLLYRKFSNWRMNGKDKFHLALPTLTMPLLAAALATIIVAAADLAKPGDFLYGLDQTIERIHLSLMRDESQLTQLHLDHASERLDEITTLVQEGQVGKITLTLHAYQKEVNSTKPLIDAVREEGGDVENLVKLLDVILTSHEEKLAGLIDAAPSETLPDFQGALTGVETIRMSIISTGGLDQGPPEGDPEPFKKENDWEINGDSTVVPIDGDGGELPPKWYTPPSVFTSTPVPSPTSTPSPSPTCTGIFTVTATPSSTETLRVITPRPTITRTSLPAETKEMEEPE